MGGFERVWERKRESDCENEEMREGRGGFRREEEEVKGEENEE